MVLASAAQQQQASMWPRLSCRGWTQMERLNARREIGFNVAAALVPRMVDHATIAENGRPSASMWPRLSCRGWWLPRIWPCPAVNCFNVAAALVPRMAGSDRSLRAGRRSFNVAAALVPRMVAADVREGERLVPASMWPRLSCRGWHRCVSHQRHSVDSLQCGRGSRAADGCARSSAASRAARLQCGRGSRAADGWNIWTWDDRST